MGVDFLISCGSGRVNWGRGKVIGCSENRGGLILAKLRVDLKIIVLLPRRQLRGDRHVS